jgi:TolB protein
MNADGSNQNQIIRSGSELLDYLPTWSPDGSLILFNQRKPNARPYIKVVSATDRADQQGSFTAISLNQIEDIDYSPDGSLLSYEGQLDGDNKDIFYIPAAGGEAVRITSSSALDFDPAWRPVLVLP